MVEKTRIAAAEYYDLPEYNRETLIQLIDGEVVIGMPPRVLHQIIVSEILFFLMTIAKQYGGRALDSPIEVYLDEHNIYEPDVLYIKPVSACRIEEKRLVGPPDLVVEVLSPSTAKHDRQQKYQAYEQHGIGEYWIVDPAHRVVEVWRLKDGQFERVGAYSPEDEFTSPILDETVKVGAFFPAVE